MANIDEAILIACIYCTI